MIDYGGLTQLVMSVVVILFPLAVIGIGAYFRNKEREMIHRERMLAMEKGLPVPPMPERHWRRRERGPRSPLFRGLVWLFVGIGAFVAMNWTKISVTEQTPGLVMLPFLAFIPLAVGLAHLIYYAVEGRKTPPEQPPGA